MRLHGVERDEIRQDEMRCEEAETKWDGIECWAACRAY